MLNKILQSNQYLIYVYIIIIYINYYGYISEVKLINDNTFNLFLSFMSNHKINYFISNISDKVLKLLFGIK